MAESELVFGLNSNPYKVTQQNEGASEYQSI